MSFSLTRHDKGTLHIEVNNIRSVKGKVWIGIYDSKHNFLVKEKAIIQGVSVSKEGPLTINVSDLTYGQYAIAIFHDENDNGELDRNLLGIPSEPFAFSRVPKSKWRLPSFDEVKFSFQDPGQKIATYLKKW